MDNKSKEVNFLGTGLDGGFNMDTDAMPYVGAALLCEKVLQEKDGTLSVVRIADRITYQLSGVPEGVKPIVQLHGLIVLRSGPAKGNFTLKLFMTPPSGNRHEMYSVPVELRGGDHGFNLVLNISLGINEDGLYWADVMFEGHLLTKIPLMVVQAEPEQKDAK